MDRFRGEGSEEPAVAVFHQEASLQARHESGADERGLAAARTADDREEAGLMQPVHQLGDLLAAPEEEQRFVLLERAEADVGTGWKLVHG